MIPSSTTAPMWTPETGFESVPMDQAGYAEPGQLLELPPAAMIRVIVSWRQAMGDQAKEREVDWPVNWRLPQQGEAVHVAEDWGGICSSVDFRLWDQAVVIYIR